MISCWWFSHVDVAARRMEDRSVLKSLLVLVFANL